MLWAQQAQKLQLAGPFSGDDVRKKKKKASSFFISYYGVIELEQTEALVLSEITREHIWITQTGLLQVPT